MSKRLLINGGIILLIVCSLYFLISRALYDYRMSNIRKGYLEIYAGCHARAFNLGSYESDPENPAQTIGIGSVNKHWEQDSREWHFDHDDVVAYMMIHCPPKSDEEIESLYSYLLDGTDRYPDMDEKQEGLKRISSEKVRRDYQLKFINKELDAFRR